MSTLAGKLLLNLRQIAYCWFAVLFPMLLLAACGSTEATRPVLIERCMQVSGTRDSTVSVVSPEAGTLSLRIEERGISVIATLDADKSSAAESPVERLGSIRLATPTKRGQLHSITVSAKDSPDISGEYCIRADLIADADRGRLSAENAFASAGRATRVADWDTAFAEYLHASREFDRLHARHSSAAARQAMAEIAYLRFDNKRDSYALASQALADYGGEAEPFVRGALIALQSKALLDIPGLDANVIAPSVRRLQAAARKYFLANPAGSRELPRLDIMTGFFVYRFSEFDRARELFLKAADSCRAARDWDCYAIASQNVALLEYEGKNYSVALAAFSNALRSLPPRLDPKLAADIWNNYGTLQGLMGFFSGSERSHAAAMHEYAQLGDCQGVRRNLARSGNLMVQLGTLGDAKNSLQQAASLDCSELLATATSQMLAEPGVTRTDAYTRNPRNVTWCTQSLEPAELAYENKLIVFNSLVSLGDALMLEGDSTVARRCFDAAGPYATTAQTQVRLADAHAEILLETQDAPGARAVFLQALQIANQANVPPAYEYRSRAQLGIVRSALLGGDAEAAIRDALPALEASVGRADMDHTVASLRLLATGYRALNRIIQATRTLQTAADLIEAVPINELDGEKRATYLATQNAVFAELTDLYASEANANAAIAPMAFATSERGRARSLRYAVTQAERDVSSETLPAARYQQLLQDVVKITDAERGSAATTLIDRLDAAALREHKAEDPFDQQQLAQTLNKLHATLVEYAVGSRDMFAFVMNESGLHVIRLGDRQQVSAAAAELHDRLFDAESPPNEIRASARRLAQLVLWPVRTELEAKRIIFVPDDGLHMVPFNILPWSDNDSERLLLQHAEVSIAPSALFLTRIHANSSQHTNTPHIVLVGDPVFRISDWHRECAEAPPQQTSARPSHTVSDWTESLPRLPGSRAEVQMIARLSRESRPSSHIETLLGCAAVPTALRRAAEEHLDLLHIATHALVDSQRPRLSALALTPERRGEATPSAFGLLDILGLKLSSGLVVLSACETSRGRLLPGEGVLGPAQAFLQAGAAAVVASYWRVDDGATSAFMQVFYRYLLAERLPAATALRKAQIEAAERFPLHDWAAFSLYGWPDSSF
jgi:CHAT domain-containing protein